MHRCRHKYIMARVCKWIENTSWLRLRVVNTMGRVIWVLSLFIRIKLLTLFTELLPLARILNYIKQTQRLMNKNCNELSFPFSRVFTLLIPKSLVAWMLETRRECLVSTVCVCAGVTPENLCRSTDLRFLSKRSLSLTMLNRYKDKEAMNTLCMQNLFSSLRVVRNNWGQTMHISLEFTRKLCTIM